MPVHISNEAGMLICYLDNPEKRNALTVDMLESLIAVFERAHEDSAVRGVVIRGVQGTFCAGRDLRELEMRGAGASAPKEVIAPVMMLAHAVLNCPVPTVAVVQGKAVGLGVALTCWCDIVVAADSALFSVPEARAGVTPTFTSVSLSRTLGRRAALALCLTGRPLSAPEALAFGLTHFVVPEAEFDTYVDGLLDDLRKGGPGALRGCKVLLDSVADGSFNEGLNLAMQTSIEAMDDDEAREGIEAFKNKRLPSWYGVQD